MTSTILLFILSIFFIFQRTQVLANACHMLCQCNGSTCLSCFQAFDISSNKTPPSNGTCLCPKGFYSKNNACLFCSDGCKYCSSQTICEECFEGYIKINGDCQLIRYDPTNSWVSYLVGQDFKTLPNGTKSIFGMSFNASKTQFSYTFENCDGAGSETFFTVKSVEALEISRVYSGLPYHQWARLTIKYVVLDEWQNEKIILRDIESGKILSNKSYNNENRSLNLCGDDHPDSIDQIVTEFSHTKSIFTLGIAIQAGTKLAIRSILLKVGTCPRNCSSCSSPTNCLVCKGYSDNGYKYQLDQGICKCDPYYGIMTGFGCIQNCPYGHVYVGEIQKCTRCSLFVPNCFICQLTNQTFICWRCDLGFYLNGGSCHRQCPLQIDSYYSVIDQKGLNCSPCPQNCSQCYSQYCSICKQNFYMLNGTCQTQCHPPFIIVEQMCQQSSCPKGCSSCNTSGSICSECYRGRWLFNGTCVVSCPDGHQRDGFSSCQPCPQNCTICITPYQCFTCAANFTLRDGYCLSSSTSCPSYYYMDIQLNICFPCPYVCLTCFKYLCYSCRSPYL